MANCLVTKLNGSSDNNELLKLGEVILELKIDKANTVFLQLVGKNCEYSCEQAHVLDTENVAANVRQNVKNWKDIKSIDAGTYRIHIFNKYALQVIKSMAVSESIKGDSFLTSLEELYFTDVENFDISQLKNLTAFTRININGNINGDISQLKNLTALTQLILGGNINGDISQLKGLTALKLLILSGDTYGDISQLKSLTALTQLILGGNINGDISQLKNLTALSKLILRGNVNMTLSSDTMKELPCRSITINWNILCGEVFGDLAVMHKNLCYFDLGPNASYTWSSRPSSSNIIALPSKATIDNIDKMLQDQAQCKVGFDSSDPSVYKLISATGNRTSASDAAVTTLQQKGYTISIAKA